MTWEYADDEPTEVNPEPATMNVSIHLHEESVRGELNRHPGSSVESSYVRLNVGELADIYFDADRLQPWIDLLSMLQYEYLTNKENEKDAEQYELAGGDETGDSSEAEASGGDDGPGLVTDRPIPNIDSAGGTETRRRREDDPSGDDGDEDQPETAQV